MPANRKEPLQAHFWFQSLFRGHGPLLQKILFAPVTCQSGAVSLLWSRTDMSRRPSATRLTITLSSLTW